VTIISANAAYKPGDIVMADLESLESGRSPGRRCRPVVLVYLSKSAAFVRPLYRRSRPGRFFIRATRGSGLTHDWYLSRTYCVLRPRSLKVRLGALDSAVASRIVAIPKEKKSPLVEARPVEPVPTEMELMAAMAPEPPRRRPVNSEWDRIGRPSGDWWRDD
jgi:hypothetical protein